MKYYEVYLEPIDEEFIGVVVGKDEDEALDNIDTKKFTRNFKFGLIQRGYTVRKISKEKYEKQKKYCKSA